MNVASVTDTERFLEGLWFRYGQTVVDAICKAYALDEAQTEALSDVLLQPNAWRLVVQLPLAGKRLGE